MSAAGRRSHPGEGAPSLPFPWDEVLAFGLGVLRLSPREFWQSSLHEIAAAANGVYGRRATAAPLRLDELEALIRAFPDLVSGDEP